MKPLRISAYALCSAIGRGRAATLSALRARRSGLTRNDFGASPVETFIGRVPGLEDSPVPSEFANWDCRNNRLAWMGLAQDGFLDAVARVRERYGPSRVAVVLGTSTSSIGATEEAYASLTPDGRFPPALRLKGAGGSTVLLADADIRAWLPGDVIYDDAVTVPPGLAAGQYEIAIALVDPETRRPRIQLAIEGREPDGWYTMGKIRVE